MEVLQNLLNIVWVAIVFLTMISILVAAHELGHYLFARWCGMGVEEFAIGFGRPQLVTWLRRTYRIPLAPGQDPQFELTEKHAGGLEGSSQPDRIKLVENGSERYLLERTDFTIRPLPLGGFVRIKGMAPDENGDETKIPGGFYNQAPWKRILVLFAGPLFSVLAGIAILVPLFMINGIDMPSSQPVIGYIDKSSAGYQSGLRKGDRVVSVDGTPIKSFYDMVRSVRDSGGRQLTFNIERSGQPMTLSVTPSIDKQPTEVLNENLEPSGVKRVQAKIGAGPNIELTRLGLGDATLRAVELPVQAVTGLARIFTKPKEIEQNVGGPGTMIDATNRAVRAGVPQVLSLCAILSISVGIFNLLPAPPLDGGQIAIAIAEMLRGGKRLSLRVQLAVGTAGTLFVIMLICTALYADAQRLVFGKPPAAKSR